MILLLIFIILNACLGASPLAAHQDVSPTMIDTHAPCYVISAQDYDRVINNPTVDFTYLSEDIKATIRMLNALHPEINTFIDLSLFIDQDTHIVPQEYVLSSIEQLLTALANAKCPAPKMFADLEQYARAVESGAIQVCIDEDDIHDGKRTVFLFNTNSGSAFPTAANINIVGGSNITTTGADSTITIGLSGSVSTSFPTDSGTATPSSGALTIHGGSNVNTSGSGSTVTVNLNNSPSVSGSVTAGTGLIATTGGINATGNSSISGGTITLNSGTNALNVSTDASSSTISITTGNGAKTATLGSTNTSSLTTIQAGTGNIVLTGSTNGIAITGTATASTQSANDDSTKLATTAYADNSNPYRLLSTQTVSNVSAVTFINLPTGYTSFQIKWYNMLPPTSGASIQLQCSTNNGTSWVSTGYYGVSLFATSDSYSDVASIGTSNGSSLLLAYSVLNVAHYACSGEMLLSNIGASQTIYPAFYGRSTYLRITNPGVSSVFVGGYVATAGCNAFQLFFSSGNITGGTFELYGAL